VEEGKVITAACVSARIDMALYLVARLTDQDMVWKVQLDIEYDPSRRSLASTCGGWGYCTGGPGGSVPARATADAAGQVADQAGRSGSLPEARSNSRTPGTMSLAVEGVYRSMQPAHVGFHCCTNSS
jgi:hypothetical protein